VILMKFCRNILFRYLLVVAIISSLVVPPGFCQETEDSQIFMSGFNAYQQKNYAAAVKRMNEVLQKYPDSPLRDMAIFWLSRSCYKNGNLQDAARYMSQFAKEYPDNPLRATVEDELLALTARYDKGETLSPGETPVKQAQGAKVKPEAGPSAEQAAKAELASQQAEKERAAAEKSDQEKQAKEQAAREQLVKQQAEQDRLAKQKADQERLLKEQAAKEQLAKQQAEKERLAKQQADQERQATEKVEQEQLAKEQAAKAQLAKQQAEKERLAKQQADQERQASEKIEQEQLAKEQAAKEQLAKQQAEQERLARLKGEQERMATEKADQERLAKEQAAKEQFARQQAEKERLAKQQADQERQASEKIEQEQLAKEQAAKEQLVKQQAEKERLARLKGEQERLATEKADQERLAKEQAAKDQFARQQAEKERLAKQQADQERQAAEKVEQEKLAQEQAAQQRRVAAQADREMLAKRKAEEERAAAEAAAAAEAGRAEQQQAAARAEERARAEKALLREKAIAQYKSIIETYPGSNAAVTAAAKLKGLGVAIALPPQAAPVERQENAQVLRFEVGQYVGFEFNLLAQPKAYEVAQRASIPFEVINRGNGSDSFSLESAFPAEFKARFATAGSPERAIRETPQLAPGEVFRGVVSFEIPSASIDGLKITYPVKAASILMTEASQSREVAMTASAPLLRAVLKADKTHLLPGGQVAYRIVVLNIGTMAARDVTLNLNYPPQLEPLDYSATGFKQGMKSVMISDGLQIRSGESREFSVAFRLKDDSLAGQELITRAELVNNPLKTTAAFVSNVAYIDPQHGVAIRTASEERLVIIPGQTTAIPFVVTNTGNVSEKYRIAANLRSPQESVVIYHDINRDGIRQANEPAITEIGPLAPREEAAVIVEVKTPRSVSDGTEDTVQLSLTPEGETTRTALASAHLFYSRPVLKMAIAARDGRLKPGEIASFDLTITNGGSNLARIVELQSTWPEQLELVGADPSNTSVSNGNILWKFKELGAGEKKAIKVSFRVKHGIGVGTNIQVKNILTYEDQLGNRY